MKRRGRAKAGSALALVLALLPGRAALPQDPTLHTRPGTPDDAMPVQATGYTNLPPEAEGRYPWNKHDGLITLFFEGGTLRGYMAEREGGAPVTLPFTATHIDGQALTFATRTVHGHSYSFTGRLVRGTAPTPALPGYYLLTGTLTGSDGQPLTLHAERRPGSP